MSSDPSQDWQRLGELLIRRRLDLDPRYRNRQIFAAERGVEYRIVSDIERARRTNFHSVTIAEIERAYGLASGAIARFLAGGGLEPQAPAAPAPAPPRRPRRLRALEDSDEPGLQPHIQAVLRQVYTAAGIISAFPPGGDLPGLDQLPELEPVLEQMPGETAFPDSATDPLLWDNPLLSAAERVRLVAKVRHMAAGHGSAGQRDRRVSGLTPWHRLGADSAVPAARYRAGIT